MPENPPFVPPTDPEPPARQSLVTRMMNVFASPSEAFESIAGMEPDHANWLAPIILFLVVSWVGAAVVLSQPAIQQQMREATERAIDRQIAKQHMPEAQAQQVRQMAEKYGAVGQTVGFYAMPPFSAFMSLFLLGLIFWLVAQHIWKAEVPYMKMVEVIGLAMTISVLEAIVRNLLILIKGSIFASPSLALFIKDIDPAKPLHSLAMLLNVFVFWSLAVRAIGFARVCRVSVGKASAWVFGLWFLYTGAMWSFGVLAQMLQRRMSGG